MFFLHFLNWFLAKKKKERNLKEIGNLKKKGKLKEKGKHKEKVECLKLVGNIALGTCYLWTQLGIK